MGKPRLSKAKYIKAIEANFGIVSAVAKTLGVTPAAVYKRRSSDKDIEEAFELATEHLLDFAESKLVKLLKDENERAIIFTLKTKGKKRGYTERHELTGKDGGPIEVSPDELDRRIARLAERSRETESP